MSAIVIDVESDGQVPGTHSMVSFGAVVVRDGLQDTFYGQCRPISDIWVPEALAISKHTREEHLTFPNPVDTMKDFAEWIAKVSVGRPVFWSDNNGYDFAFINYYFHTFHTNNPFGWSSQNINSLYKGLRKDAFASFKSLRKTKHTHHPVDDALGNAEALLRMKALYDIKIPFK